MNNIILPLFTLCLGTISIAQTTHVSIQSGDFDDCATWGLETNNDFTSDGTPANIGQDGDDIFKIAANHVVNIPNNTTVFASQVLFQNTNAKLIFNNGNADPTGVLDLKNTTGTDISCFVPDANSITLHGTGVGFIPQNMKDIDTGHAAGCFLRDNTTMVNRVDITNNAPIAIDRIVYREGEYWDRRTTGFTGVCSGLGSAGTTFWNYDNLGTRTYTNNNNIGSGGHVTDYRAAENVDFYYNRLAGHTLTMEVFWVDDQSFTYTVYD
jgi:hypothetical protein